MKRLLILFGALIAILIAAAVIVPFLIPSSVYKAQIESSASTTLDRDVRLIGEPKLSILPVIAAEIQGVEISNPDGFTDPLMIEAGTLRARVKLLPLLSRRVEIDKVTLNDATVRLERLSDGRVNWQFGAHDADAPAPAPGEESGGFDTGIDRAGLTNASIFYKDWTTGDQYALTEFNANAQMRALDKPLSSSGNGRLNGQAFDYRIRLNTLAALNANEPVVLDAKLGTIYGDIAYDGALTLAETANLEGDFELSSDTLGQALGILGDADLPIVATALKSVRAKGSVSGPAASALLDFSRLQLEATGLDLDYEGTLQLGTVPRLDGTVDLNAADAARLLKPGNDLIPLLILMGDVDFSASLRGPITAPSLTGIRLKQSSPDLVTNYSGDFSFAGDQVLDGMLDLRSDNPRAVLETFGTVLPEGESLNRLEIKGKTTGRLTAPTLSAAELTLDDSRATGSIGADFNGARPRLIADLTMTQLDLTPFLGSGSQQQDTDPSLNEDWDDTPFDLAALRAVDATVTVAAGEVLMDQITLNDAKLSTRVDDGRLSAIFRRDDETPGFRVFGGNWYGDLVLDASRSTPTLEIEALADSIAAQDMLTALTGFQNLRGLGDVHFGLSSEGNSLKALINGLDGNFETDLNQGALKGVNLAKLVQDGANLQTLLRSGGLTVASFREAISPDAETDFSDFIGALEINNGVASITNLRIDNAAVGVTGSGQIDLGARTLDLRLVPRVDVEAAGAGSTIGIGNIPVPLRVYGDWSNVRYGLDSAAVQTELTSRLRAQAGGQIADSIGGDAGAIIGGIVGGGDLNDILRPTPDAEDSSEAPEPSVEEELERRLLGALFGTSDDSEPTTDQESSN